MTNILRAPIGGVAWECARVCVQKGTVYRPRPCKARAPRRTLLLRTSTAAQWESACFTYVRLWINFKYFQNRNVFIQER